MDAPILQLQTEGGAAMSMRSTRGCGRGRPRLGGLTVEQTTVRQAHASEAQKKRGAETRQSRKVDQA